METKMAENVTEMTREQEEEARLADEVREEAVLRTSNRHVHPGLIAWLAARGNLFSENVRGDLQNAPERHPDVRLLKRLLPQSSFALHVRLAWLCWRARQIRFFGPQAGWGQATWEQALQSADARDVMHDEAFEARARYYAQRPSIEQRRVVAEAEEEALALTLMHLHTEAKIPTAEVDIPVPDASSHVEKERQMELARTGGVKVRKAKNQNQK